MSFRTLATTAVCTLFGLGSVTAARAQPVVPPRPTYSPYMSHIPTLGWGSGWYGLGFGGQGYQLQQQNYLLQQQLNLTNQSLTTLQTFAAYGVNPYLPVTGRGAVFNNLGHWYPMARNAGGGGGFVGGPLIVPRTSGIVPGTLGTAMMGAAVGQSFQGGGGARPAGGGVKR